MATSLSRKTATRPGPTRLTAVASAPARSRPPVRLRRFATPPDRHPHLSVHYSPPGSGALFRFPLTTHADWRPGAARMLPTALWDSDCPLDGCFRQKGMSDRRQARPSSGRRRIRCAPGPPSGGGRSAPLFGLSSGLRPRRPFTSQIIYRVILSGRSIPSRVCGTCSWVSMKQTWTYQPGLAVILSCW